MTTSPYFICKRFTVGILSIFSLFVLLAAYIPLGYSAEQNLVETPVEQVSWLTAADGAHELKLEKTYGTLPMHFEVNQGQTDAQVKFLSRGRGYTLFLTADEAVLALSKPAHAESETDSPLTSVHTDGADASVGDVLRMRLIDANRPSQVVGLEKLPGKVNYFTGKSQKEWRTNIPTYAKVKYERVYEGIDVVYYGNQRQLEYDFIVAAGADPGVIRFRLEGAEQIEVDARGDLVLHMSEGKIRFKKPFIYQVVGGARHEIAGAYTLYDEHQTGFQVADYDRSKPLIIDPVLAYSTYLGGSALEFAYGIAVDAVGSAYVTGETQSVADFPTAGAFQPGHAGGFRDVFVTKLNPAGSALVYSTYFGGNREDFGFDITVDADGNAYITGDTTSKNFPTVRAFQTILGGPFSLVQVSNGFDAFVVKLNPFGNVLLYSSYLGGFSTEVGWGIAVDAERPIGGERNIYVTGYTTSTSFTCTARFPTKRSCNFNPGNAYAGDPVNTVLFFGVDVAGCRAAFVTKVDPSQVGAASFIYSTGLGGRCLVEGHGIAVDAAGLIYVAGQAWTNSTFPTTVNAFQATSNAPAFRDAFVTVLDPDAPTQFSDLVYSTVFGGKGTGGNEGEIAFDIALDSSRNAYIAGLTSEFDTPTKNPIQPDQGGQDAFVAKIDPYPVVCTPDPTEPIRFPCVESLIYATYLGGPGTDQARSIAVDAAGNAYVTGLTTFDIPTVDPFQPVHASFGVQDAFVAKLNDAGSALVYSSFLGGDGTDQGRGIALDPDGNAYVTGLTNSTNFPTVGPFQPTLAGSFDAFVTKIETQTPDDQGPVTTAVTANPNPVGVGRNVDLTANVDDTELGDSVIASAEYSLDGIGGPWTAMVASDGDFDEVSENVRASFNAPAAAGIFDLCVRGMDDPGNVGDPECIMLVAVDADGDGVPDDGDSCPNTMGNPVDDAGCSDAQVDIDNDGFCDVGAPSDGPSSCDGTDNCPTVFNPGQVQTGENVGGPSGDACVDPTVQLPADLNIGANPIISSGVSVEAGVVIGNDVQMGSGVQIKQGVTVGDNVTVSAETILEYNVTLGDDVFLGFKVKIEENVMIGSRVSIGDLSVIKKNVIIKDDVSIGAFVTIEDGAVIGVGAVIGDGAKIEADVVVPDGAIVPAGATVSL